MILINPVSNSHTSLQCSVRLISLLLVVGHLEICINIECEDGGEDDVKCNPKDGDKNADKGSGKDGNKGND